MAPHLTPAELNSMQAKSASGQTPLAIHSWLEKARAKKKLEAPSPGSVRKALKGKTYKRGVVETRGRKRMLSSRAVKAINAARKKLLKKAGNEEEVTWDQCRRAAKATKCDPTTVARSFQREGLDVKARPPREKPQREAHHEEDRKTICKRWARYPENYFHELDLITDNKRFKVATYKRAVKYLKQTKIRRHLRTRSEGIAKECVKPSQKKQKMNPGGSVHILCGISKGKIALWHNVGKAWNSKVAAECYKGPMLKALKKHCGDKASYRIMEDNDPVGYKSSAGEAAKKEAGIKAIEYPRHSPDLNPLDFSLWHEIERRMAALVNKPMSVKDYEAKLRRVALALPKSLVEKAVGNIRVRAKAVAQAKGGNIARD